MPRPHPSYASSEAASLANRCAAAGNTGPDSWAECQSEGVTLRFVVLDGWLIEASLCDAHALLWANDYGHAAIWAGQSVTTSARVT